MTRRADDGAAANRAYELARMATALGSALDAVERLREHGDLSPLSDSVASMLANDVATAFKRLRWLEAADERRSGAA
jgi:hypothetical protein